MRLSRIEIEKLIFKYEELFAQMTNSNNVTGYGLKTFSPGHMECVKAKLIALKAELRMMEDEFHAKEEEWEKSVDEIVEMAEKYVG